MGSGRNEGEGIVISGQRLGGLGKKRVYWENFLITSHFEVGFAPVLSRGSLGVKFYK